MTAFALNLFCLVYFIFSHERVYACEKGLCMLINGSFPLKKAYLFFETVDGLSTFSCYVLNVPLQNDT